MSHAEKVQQKIDAYLMQLRRSLGELPPDEVDEILKEIRGHILERAEASGELTEERLVAILKALGNPEQIAPLYQADACVARARSSLSPRVVMRGIHRWSTVSVWGFVLFVLGVVGLCDGKRARSGGPAQDFQPGPDRRLGRAAQDLRHRRQQRSGGPGRSRLVARAGRASSAGRLCSSRRRACCAGPCASPESGGPRRPDRILRRSASWRDHCLKS